MFPMWMSELSQRSGLPVATIKFYLRDGLLHPGEAVGATRARYDETHLRRLRLIRALVDLAALRLEDVRNVLEAVDDESLTLHEAMGSAHDRLSAQAGPPPSQESVDRVDVLVKRHGWQVAPGSAHRQALARALDANASLEHEVSDALLDGYVTAMSTVAAREVAGAATGAGRATATRRAVEGTLLLEPVLLAIRRMAQENASAGLTGVRTGRPAPAAAGSASGRRPRRSR